MAALAAAKDGTVDRPLDLVGMTDLPVKKLRTKSHAREASDLVANVEKASDDAANSKAAAEEISDPAIEVEKEAMVGDAPVKEVAQETRPAPTQSPTEVIDGNDKVASSGATVPFPMASIGSITLLRQLEMMIQVCPVIHLQCIYNFLCSMLVYTPFAYCFVTLRGTFMHFLELTY
jgi:hypothetical protein